uniref:Uncharacterized protein n=1 Tax=Sphaerodactylus townsendi TaxID=933632 RepID=A0ACB8G5T6_9SAUR
MLLSQALSETSVGPEDGGNPKTLKAQRKQIQKTATSAPLMAFRSSAGLWQEEDASLMHYSAAAYLAERAVLKAPETLQQAPEIRRYRHHQAIITTRTNYRTRKGDEHY